MVRAAGVLPWCWLGEDCEALRGHPKGIRWVSGGYSLSLPCHHGAVKAALCGRCRAPTPVRQHRLACYSNEVAVSLEALFVPGGRAAGGPIGAEVRDAQGHPAQNQEGWEQEDADRDGLYPRQAQRGREEPCEETDRQHHRPCDGAAAGRLACGRAKRACCSAHCERAPFRLAGSRPHGGAANDLSGPGRDAAPSRRSHTLPRPPYISRTVSDFGPYLLFAGGVRVVKFGETATTRSALAIQRRLSNGQLAPIWQIGPCRP